MSGSNPAYETPTRRILWLGVAFAALVAIGVFTVLRPELAQEPEAQAAGATAAPAVGEPEPAPASPAP